MEARAEAEAFEDFYRQYYARLVKALCFIRPDVESAADAAQEAFFQVHLCWDRFEKDDDRLRWVYRVAVNRCKDYRRHLARARRFLERLAGEAPPESGLTWYPEREFMEALKGLPERQRTAAALHYLAGLSQRETASVMRISEGAVKSHLFRAREALSTKLEVE